MSFTPYNLHSVMPRNAHCEILLRKVSRISSWSPVHIQIIFFNSHQNHLLPADGNCVASTSHVWPQSLSLSSLLVTLPCVCLVLSFVRRLVELVLPLSSINALCLSKDLSKVQFHAFSSLVTHAPTWPQACSTFDTWDVQYWPVSLQLLGYLWPDSWTGNICTACTSFALLTHRLCQLACRST